MALPGDAELSLRVSVPAAASGPLFAFLAPGVTRVPLFGRSPIDAPQPIGEDVWVEAVAKDASEVFSLEVRYRRETSSEWSTVGMTRVGDTPQGEALYQGAIRGQDISSSGMRAGPV